ncbi:MAG: hypothetical protein IPN24_07815 [Betaproteobacteria bacterium]|nr:hypothetical protein [Betaproteobacteria bacterium]
MIGGGITSIAGSIGGDDDSVDAFRFFFGGGTLYVTAQLESSINGMRTLPIALFREDAGRADPLHLTDPYAQVPRRDPACTRSGRAPYVVGACYPPNPRIDVDPPFTIGFPSIRRRGSSPSRSARPSRNRRRLVLLLSGLMALRRATPVIRCLAAAASIATGTPRVKCGRSTAEGVWKLRSTFVSCDEQ